MPTKKSKILALIPARGGSKGIPRKNIRLIAGKPLLAWTISAARQCPLIDDIVVSTDDPEIAQVARDWGASTPFMRPPELARDETPGVAPVLHAISMLPGYDYVLLLQPTSPLRGAEDISASINLALATGADSVVSVSEPDTHPYWVYKCDDEGRLIRLIDTPAIYSRQELPPVVALNGAIYLSRVDYLKKVGALVTPSTIALRIPRERSIDIDTMIDWKIAEILLKEAE